MYPTKLSHLMLVRGYVLVFLCYVQGNPLYGRQTPDFLLCVIIRSWLATLMLKAEWFLLTVFHISARKPFLFHLVGLSTLLPVVPFLSAQVFTTRSTFTIFAVGEVPPRLMTMCTLTGHAVISVGPYSISLDNGPARREGLSSKLQASGEVWGDPIEV